MNQQRAPLSSETERAHGQPSSQADSITPGVDDNERDVVTSGTAATSELADREVQDDAEGQGDETPQRS